MKRAGPPPVVWSEQLLATIFHQLRTPISSINGYAALLLTGELGKLSPHQRETVERLQEICQSITNLTGNLLALTKSNRGKIQGTK
ncbi:MAG: hypothetical protein HYZ93_06955, partial [Candidatus Omnitrophica bacterium]|nr:hypothetical protein [Candidatus Omnitrophota bacterium]